MKGLRILFRRHATIALMIVGLALGVRALVPAGYMTMASPGGLTVALCSGVAGKTVTIALPGHGGRQEHGKTQADSPCAFTALGQATGSAVDTILLAIAVAFIISVALRLADAPAIAGYVRMRPPLRGPPLEA